MSAAARKAVFDAHEAVLGRTPKAQAKVNR
jgi:hypothetical protein